MRRFLVSTTTELLRPWEKLCRTVPGARGFNDSVPRGVLPVLFSSPDFVSLIYVLYLFDPLWLSGAVIIVVPTSSWQFVCRVGVHQDGSISRYFDSWTMCLTQFRAALPSISAACITFVAPSAMLNCEVEKIRQIIISCLPDCTAA